MLFITIPVPIRFFISHRKYAHYTSFPFFSFPFSHGSPFCLSRGGRGWGLEDAEAADELEWLDPSPYSMALLRQVGLRALEV